MANTGKKFTQALLFFMAVSIFYGCGAEKIEKERFLFKTLIKITVYSEDKGKALKAVDEAFAEMERIDRVINNHSDNGMINLINKNAGEYVKTDEETRMLLKKAVDVSEETNGTYDITISPVMELWGFDRENIKSLPDKEEMDKRLKLVNYKDIVIENEKVLLKNKDEKIEAGSFLKGYAIKKAGDRLKSLGINSAFISAVSSIEAIGAKPERNGEPARNWRFGIENPDGGEYLGVLDIKDKAIGVAGDYQTFIEINGKKYHHILSVKNGYPIEEIRLVVVVADDAFTADLYDTALFTSGTEKALDIAEKNNLEAMIMDKNGKIFKTKGFAKYMK